jgi:hypothetical protein
MTVPFRGGESCLVELHQQRPIEHSGKVKGSSRTKKTVLFPACPLSTQTNLHARPWLSLTRVDPFGGWCLQANHTVQSPAHESTQVLSGTSSAAQSEAPPHHGAT